MSDFSNLSKEQAQNLFFHFSIENLPHEVRDLLRARPDIDVNQPEPEGPGESMLLHAVRQSNSPLLDVLLEAGADTEVQDAEGNTPFLRAVACNETAMAQALLAAGADHATENLDGESALLCCDAQNPQSVPVIRLLLNLGHDPSVRGVYDDTMLFGAAAADIPELAELLLQAGCDPLRENEMSDAPADVASRAGAPQVERAIRAHAALPRMKDGKVYDAEELFRPRVAGKRLVDNPANWWLGMADSFAVLEMEGKLPDKTQLLEVGASGKSAAEVAFGARQGALVMRCLAAHGQALEQGDLFAADKSPTPLLQAMLESGQSQYLLRDGAAARYDAASIRHIHAHTPQENRNGMGLHTLLTQAAYQQTGAVSAGRGR